LLEAAAVPPLLLKSTKAIAMMATTRTDPPAR
jgi:hypothetical protein